MLENVFYWYNEISHVSIDLLLVFFITTKKILKNSGYKYFEKLFENKYKYYIQKFL